MKLISLYNSDRKVKVDDDDFKFLVVYRWRQVYRGYSATTIKGRTVLMHRVIMKAPKELVVDHLNHDKLDNRKANLRLCSWTQNQGNRLANGNNRSGHRGVSKFRDKWRVFVGRNYIGVFDELEEAVKAQKEFADKHFA